MKRGWIVALVFAIIFIPVISFAKYQSPGKPTGFLNDFAGILSTQTRNDLENKLISFKKESSFEISVVTINSLEGESIEMYSIQLAREWGIGREDKNTGVLLLISPNDRQVRIEVGYGLEGALTDSTSALIIKNVMSPSFKEGNYDKGIMDGVDAIIGVLRGEISTESFSNSTKSDWSSLYDVVGGLVYFIFLVIIAFLAKTKSWWLGGVIGALFGVAIWIFVGLGIGLIATISLAILGLVIDFIVSKRGGGGGFFGGWGGGHGGFGGGGFGGFGGGGFGGGGASGRW